jgi:hypothetical protein
MHVRTQVRDDAKSLRNSGLDRILAAVGRARPLGSDIFSAIIWKPLLDVAACIVTVKI